MPLDPWDHNGITALSYPQGCGCRADYCQVCYPGSTWEDWNPVEPGAEGHPDFVGPPRPPYRSPIAEIDPADIPPF